MKKLEFPTYEEFKKITEELSKTIGKVGLYCLAVNISADIEVLEPTTAEIRVFAHYQNSVGVFKQIQIAKAKVSSTDSEEDYNGAIRFLKEEVALLSKVLAGGNE